MREQRFRDRTEAGRLLASRLTAYASRPDVLVLALPRGGVPVGYEVARALHAPLDVIIVRKLGVPGQEELALGAIASGGVRVLNDDLVRMLALPEKVIDSVVAHERRELERREQLYRGDRPTHEVCGRTIILVDDGMATGATMRAAVAAVKQQQSARIVIAVPVAASATCEELAAEVDDVVCVIRPEAFFAVGFWYERFSQTTDEEVADLLEQATHERMAMPQQQRRASGAESRKQRTWATPSARHRSRGTASSSHISRNNRQPPAMTTEKVSKAATSLRQPRPLLVGAGGVGAGGGAVWVLIELSSFTSRKLLEESTRACSPLLLWASTQHASAWLEQRRNGHVPNTTCLARGPHESIKKGGRV